MRITLNLASRPFTDLGPAIKRLRIAAAAMALLSLGLLLGLHAVHQKAEAARAREHSLDGAIAKIESERQGYAAMMQRPDNAQFMRQVGLLNQMFDEKAFSWTLAMENLETVLPAGVQVTQIEPVRAKNGQTTLHLRVLGPHDQSIELVRNLEHSKRFLSPRIVGESAETSGNGPNQRVEPVSPTNRFEFDLLADYIPPTAEERARGHKKEISLLNGATAGPSRPARPVADPGARRGRPPYPSPPNPTPSGPLAHMPAPKPHADAAPGGPQ
jgi:type IV pilus assembly protein PilN